MDIKVKHYILGIIVGIIVISLVLWGKIGVENNLRYFTELFKTKESEPTSNVIILSDSCSSNSDCSWQITNCCAENAGGKWECVNTKQSKIECNTLILCPQVLSPKPSNQCLCSNRRCIG